MVWKLGEGKFSTGNAEKEKRRSAHSEKKEKRQKKTEKDGKKKKEKRKKWLYNTITYALTWM